MTLKKRKYFSKVYKKRLHFTSPNERQRRAFQTAVIRKPDFWALHLDNWSPTINRRKPPWRSDTAEYERFAKHLSAGTERLNKDREWARKGVSIIYSFKLNDVRNRNSYAIIRACWKRQILLFTFLYTAACAVRNDFPAHLTPASMYQKRHKRRRSRCVTFIASMINAASVFPVSAK